MSWAHTATFYEQLAVTLDAGLTVVQAVQLAGDTAGGPFRAHGVAWSTGCAAGRGMAEQLAQTRQPMFDIALVKAGETSGRLPELCRELAANYRHRIALRNLVVSRLIYPVLLIHVTLMTAGVVLAFLCGWGLWIILGLPLALWVLVGGCFAGFRLLGANRQAHLALIGPFAPLTLPLVGANTCTVLRAALSAGLMGPDALELTAGACGNRVLAAQLMEAARDLRHNRLDSITAALARARLPPIVIDHVKTGEFSGKLDQNLGQAAILMRESFRLRAEWTARVVCGLIYGGAMLAGAVLILFVVSGYVNMLGDVMKDQPGG
ncbi:MAG TPA: type II secretion system F family protein [Planctomycetota bacterium]|jgi:general secretion pathway protein F|nr:type II secretion system F family protein [Planctomycetota bacterium]